LVAEALADNTRLVVGLGNPGRRYDRTRHNVGFRVVDALAERWSASGRNAHDGVLFDARVSRAGHPSVRVLLLKPETFMNRSGQAVVSVANYYRLDPSDVLAVLDDIDLPTGKIRARSQGSAGGHKGLADILAKLGADSVARLRVGVGQPPEPMASEDYVLGRFTDDEEAVIRPAISAAADAVVDWIFQDTTAVMNRYNATPNESAEPTTNGSQTTDSSS